MELFRERTAQGAALSRVQRTGVDSFLFGSTRNMDVTYRAEFITPDDLESLCTCRTPFIEGLVCKHVIRLCSLLERRLDVATLVHPAITTEAGRASYTAGGDVKLGMETAHVWRKAPIRECDLLMPPLW